MTNAPTTHRDGRTIQPGDVIRVIGRFERVVSIEPYVGKNAFLDGSGERARIARFADGTGMTLFATSRVEVIA